MRQTVLKIQRSLSTTENEPQVLMYDQLKLVTYQGPLSKVDPSLVEIIGDSAKIYIEATITLGEIVVGGKKQITADLSFGKVLPDQGW